MEVLAAKEVIIILLQEEQVAMAQKAKTHLEMMLAVLEMEVVELLGAVALVMEVM